MQLHGDVHVRLADGSTLEAKHVQTGDSLATADGGTITVTEVIKTMVSHPHFITALGHQLRALAGTSVLRARRFVPLDTLDAVLVEEEPAPVAVYGIYSRWCKFARVPAIECGGLHVRIHEAPA